MPDIYVTYRDGDSSNDEVQSFVKELKSLYGNYWVTVSDANPKANILDLREQVRKHQVLLVFIGKRFHNIIDEKNKPLLDDAYDYLHAEILAALDYPDVELVYILTDNADMPKLNLLPEDLKQLVNQHFFVMNETDSLHENVVQFDKWFKKLIPDNNNNEYNHVEFKKSKQSIYIKPVLLVAFIIAILLAGRSYFKFGEVDNSYYYRSQIVHEEIINDAGSYWYDDPNPSTVVSVDNGEELFEQHCESCHYQLSGRGNASIDEFRRPWDSSLNLSPYVRYVPSHGQIVDSLVIPFDDVSLERDDLYDIQAYVDAFYEQ
ncbi:MAG: hypothetical protein Phog2KO_14870 [Phototrophicaceae bacterium]